MILNKDQNCVAILYQTYAKGYDMYIRQIQEQTHPGRKSHNKTLLFQKKM